MNEIYKICDVYNLDYKHVLNLCSTKWNFVNFKPGLVGGHCVPVDPYYLVEDLKKKKYSSNLISLARENNENFVKYVLKKLINKIKPLKNKKILFCGINFKNNVYDKRNSKYYSIYLNLKKKYNCNLFLDSDSYRKNMDKHISNHNIFIIGSSNLNIKRLQKKILTEKKSKKVIISILSKRINSKNKNIKIINI
jgi:UDP-N-acetyl-D-galactosamine dehydrogenase